jgi:hypothetical protein
MPEPETVSGLVHIASKGVCADRAPIDQMLQIGKVFPLARPDYTIVISHDVFGGSISI